MMATLKALRDTDHRDVMADLYEATDDVWRTTQEIAQRAGYVWPPGASTNAYARTALFALMMNTDVEHLSRKNGHLWRRPLRAAVTETP